MEDDRADELVQLWFWAGLPLNLDAYSFGLAMAVCRFLEDGEGSPHGLLARAVMELVNTGAG